MNRRFIFLLLAILGMVGLQAVKIRAEALVSNQDVNKSKTKAGSGVSFG